MSSVLIQRAIFDKLKTDLDVPIFDFVTDNATLPYVVIGQDTHIPFDTNESTGAESTITIHVYSKYKGMVELKQIQDFIYTSLNRAELNIIGTNMISCEEEFRSSNLSYDNQIIMAGVQRFRLLTLN